MKILFWLSFLVLIPLVVGLALLLSGISAGAWILEIGVPAVLIILVFSGIVLLVKGKLYSHKTDKDKSASEVKESEKEQAAIDAVNETRLYESQFALGEYEAGQIEKAMKQAPKTGFILGIVFFLLLLADAILATVLLIKHIYIGAIVCAALFGVTVVTLIIAAVIKETLSMHADIRKAKKIVGGNVKYCVMSSMVTSHARYYSRRINGVIYRVCVTADGGEYEAFSNRFFETGEEVTIAVMGKKRAKIVTEDELKELETQNSAKPRR